MQPAEVRRKWEPYIGRFFLSFTAIEHIVTITIDVLSKKQISKTARTLLFEKRTDLLSELLRNNDKLSEKTKEKFLAQIDSALMMTRNVRNIIAHNHILMELYKDQNDDFLYEIEYIYSYRNRNKKISFDELVEKSNQTEQLAFDISNTYMELVREWWRK